MAVTVDKLIQIGRLASGTDAEITSTFGASAKDGFLYQVTDKDSYRIGKPDGSLTDPILTMFTVLGDTGSLSITQLTNLGIKGGDLVTTSFSGNDITLGFDLTGGSPYQTPRLNATGDGVEWAAPVSINPDSSTLLSIDSQNRISVTQALAFTKTYDNTETSLVNWISVTGYDGTQDYDLVVLTNIPDGQGGTKTEVYLQTGDSGNASDFSIVSFDYQDSYIKTLLAGGEGITYTEASGQIALTYLRQTGNDLEYFDNTSWGKVWTAENDGSGSGLDADLLDGQEGSYYLDYGNFTNKPSVSHFTNDVGYLTSFTETDTLASVLARGNISNVDIHLNNSSSKIGLGGLGTSGTGGWFQGTGIEGSEAGYGTWITNNLYFNGINWTKPRATTGAMAATINNHKNFSIYRIGAGGTDGDTYSFADDSYMLLQLGSGGHLYIKDGGATLLQVATRNYVTNTINTQYFNDLGDTDADKLGGQSPSYYRNPANFTWSLANGYLPYFDGSSLADSNIIQDPNGFSLAAQKYFVGSLGIGGQPVGEFDVTGTLRSNHNIAANNAYNIFAIRSNRQINDYGGLNKDYWLLNFKSEVGNHYFGDLIFKASRTNTSTLYDALRISALGQVEASAAGRFKGWMDSKSTGLGAEIGISGGQGYLTAYDRTTSTYSNFNINIGNGEGLHLNASTYRVGIHNASPGYTLDVTGDINATAKYTGGTNSTTHRNFLDLSYSASKANAAILFPNSSSIQFQEDSALEGRIIADFDNVFQIENSGDIYLTRAGQLEASVEAGFFSVANNLRVSGLTGDKYLFNDATNKVTEKTLEQLQKDVLGSSNTANVFDVNQASHGFTVGGMVYWGGTQWDGSIADIEDNVKFSVGVVVEVIDINSFKVATTGVFNITGHGFTIGANYAVSTTTAQAVVNANTLDIGSDIIWFAFTVIDANRILIQNKKYLV